MSPLKAAAPWNKLAILVTPEVTQSLMSPYVDRAEASFDNQRATAVPMLASVNAAGDALLVFSLVEANMV